MLMPRWFLIVNGAALLCLGGAMLYLRLREEGSLSAPRRFFGLLWSLLCCLVGAALLAMAAGHLRQPGEGAPAPRRPVPVFPTGR